MVRRYRPVEKSALLSWRAELTARQNPKGFRGRVEEIHQGIESDTFYNQGGMQFLRDAWIAGRVATALQAESVRLLPEERPDFEIGIGGSFRLFEATEADEPNRRRGDEYRKVTTEIEWDPVEDWRRRFDAIPASVRTVVSKKLEKRYEKWVNLVIYVNLSSYGAYTDEGIAILKDETEAAKDAFQEIYVLWEGSLYSFWKEGSANFSCWSVFEVEDH